MLEELKYEIPYDEIRYDKHVAKISVIGVGMRSHSGVASKAFQALANDSVNILMISTSEIKVTCLIEEKYTELAVRTLHHAFDLDSDSLQKIMSTIQIYDTTLRDGSQAEELNIVAKDKVLIARALDQIGIHYIEGGWPGANPTDDAFFQSMAPLTLTHSRLVAFGSTHHPTKTAETDKNLKALINSQTQVATIFGKCWDMQAQVALGISLERNIEIIAASIAFLKQHFAEVFFDAEHLFDGFKANPEFSLACLDAALQSGADCLIACDTNGGSLPNEVAEITSILRQKFPNATLGIHAHNDAELAVACTLAAVEQGATHVQGTINGYGERCGNANLCSIIPNLEFKKGLKTIGAKNIEGLTDLRVMLLKLRIYALFCVSPLLVDQRLLIKEAFMSPQL